MADGAVETPAGKITPALRMHAPNDHKPTDELASASEVVPLPAGANRLRFTGQWGIDFDIYILADKPQQAIIGNWGYRWAPGGEAGEFKRATGRPFEECQHILRIRGEGGFVVAIFPWRKGDAARNVMVRGEGGKMIVSEGGQVTAIE